MMLENRPMEAGGVITRLFSIDSVLRNYFFNSIFIGHSAATDDAIY